MRNRLAILSPSLELAGNGVADYASLLASEYSKSIEVILLSTSKVKCQLKGSITVERDKSSLCEILQSYKISHLLINYSNYGFQNKGIPFWMVSALKEIRDLTGIEVSIFFHEIYASGKPWEISFWTHWFQKQIFRKLYKLAHHSFCSNMRVDRLIACQVDDKGVKNRNIGMFSNIPEPLFVEPAIRENGTAIVFGSLGRRQAVYDSLEFNSWIINNKIMEVWDIGVGEVKNTIRCKFIRCGILSKEEISDKMLSATFGLIEYPESLLGKSGIFAAYAAHKLTVVNFSTDKYPSYEELKKGVHYLGGDSIVNQNLAFGEKLYNWYQPRNFNNHITKLIQTISI